MAEYTVTKNSIKANDYEALISLDELILTGTITASRTDFSYRTPVDMGEMTVLEKINTLYNLNAIDDSSRIEYYCYALLDSRVKNDCTTSLWAEIQTYKNAHKNEKLSSSLQDAINSVIESREMSSRETTSTVSGSIGSFSYVINYDSSITSSGAQRVASEFESIYNYFVTNHGFKSPIPYSGTVYQITVISGDGLGFTASNSVGGSFIEIADHVVNNRITYPDSFKKVLAHEFFHAITFAYDPNVYEGYPNRLWFREGFANCAGLVYTGVSEATTENQVRVYFNLSNKSLFQAGQNGGEYGTFFYPYYIYLNLGGWNAIKSILNQLPITPMSTSSLVQAITNSPYISTAGYAFLAAATRTYAPTYYYPLATPAWGAPSSEDLAYEHPYDLEGMAYKFHKYTTGSNIANFSCKFTIDGNNPSGMELNIIKTNDSNYYSIATLTSGYSEIYVTLNNLSNTTAIVFCPVNTNVYENLNNHMTYSFSTQ